MKKLALMMCALCILAGTGLSVNAAEDVTQKPAKEEIIQQRKAREAAFEQKLGLTEAQKAKAKELRIKGRERMKPVIDEIKSKKQEAKMIKLSRMAVQMQEEKLAEIDKELKVLEKKAHEIRKQNMKDFESILTREQRKILKQMKQEGRKKFESEHHKG